MDAAKTTAGLALGHTAVAAGDYPALPGAGGGKPRYPSAAHLALDLADPSLVKISDRAHEMQGASLGTHIKRWFKAAGMEYKPSPLPMEQIDQVPVMVALPYKDVTDATLYSLRVAVNRALGSGRGTAGLCDRDFTL